MKLIKIAKVGFVRPELLQDYNAEGFDLCVKDRVIVESDKGLRFGTVQHLRGEAITEERQKNLKKTIRRAHSKDLSQLDKNLQKGKVAFDYCLERVKHRKLKMKLLDVEYNFVGNAAIFYFSADGRVDFRELVKDLASRLRIRVEMKQVGVRDELKLIGAIGICGRETCCTSFLQFFSPISIKMAKNQNLPLNPSKVSGVCGRLLCCLEYENEAYLSLKKGLPEVGKHIKVNRFAEKVKLVELDLFKGKATVLSPDRELVQLDCEEIRVHRKSATKKIDPS